MKNQQLVRLKFIDAMLFEFKYFRRSFLVDLFEISEITATRDLQVYQEMQPGVYYDRSAKVFKASVDFRQLQDFWDYRSPKDFIIALQTVFNMEIGNIQVTQLGVKRRD